MDTFRKYIPGLTETTVHPDGTVETTRDVIDVTMCGLVPMMDIHMAEDDEEYPSFRDDCPKCGDSWTRKSWCAAGECIPEHPDFRVYREPITDLPEHVHLFCGCGYRMAAEPLYP